MNALAHMTSARARRGVLLGGALLLVSTGTALAGARPPMHAGRQYAPPMPKDKLQASPAMVLREAMLAIESATGSLRDETIPGDLAGLVFLAKPRAMTEIARLKHHRDLVTKALKAVLAQAGAPDQEFAAKTPDPAAPSRTFAQRIVAEKAVVKKLELDRATFTQRAFELAQVAGEEQRKALEAEMRDLVEKSNAAEAKLTGSLALLAKLSDASRRVAPQELRDGLAGALQSVDRLLRGDASRMQAGLETRLERIERAIGTAIDAELQESLKKPRR